MSFQVIQVWNDQTGCKWWWIWHFWVNYSLQCAHTIRNACSSTFYFLLTSCLILYLSLSLFPFVFSPSLIFSPPFTHTRKNTSTKTSGNSWLCTDPGLCCYENRFATVRSLFTCLQVWTYRIVTLCARTLQPYWWCLNSRVNTSLTKANSIQYPRQQGFHTKLLLSWTLGLRWPESICSTQPSEQMQWEGSTTFVPANHQCSFDFEVHFTANDGPYNPVTSC